MNKYPEEVWQEALKLCSKYYIDKDSVVVEVISAAILSERDRCADVAAGFGGAMGQELYEKIMKGGAA